MNISVFNGTGQVDYMYGLVSGLACNKNDSIDVLDVDLTQELFSGFENVNYVPVFKYYPRSASVAVKTINILRYYLLQFWFLVSHKPRIIHFQWLDRHIVIDRIILPAIARLFGHKVVLTVHNINAGKRDNRDTSINRLTLRTLYRLSNKLIVHTPQSKVELMNEFPVAESKIEVIKHGMNNRVAKKGTTTAQARLHFGLNEDDKVILFFGNIDYYKGLDILIESLLILNKDRNCNYKVLIAGNSKSPEYTAQVLEKAADPRLKGCIDAKIQYIPDEDVELYFMASDCIVLPYRNIYQSGVIFMAYTFGLPLIVTDVGNFRNDVIEGKTGFLVKPEDPEDLAKIIADYFKTDLYTELEKTREEIQNWAWQNYSWEVIGSKTRELYLSIK
ncbi:MAG: glycosyl transferase group [Bacteroidetes bacterium]|nr:MAG: glycosyl transferase group [Bacteroidota bacterium]